MLTYNLEQRNDEPKYYYIYKMIRRDIERGKLKKGEKLPSKRSLAEHLGISLITVENAYQMLKDEGYIEPRERSGYYVCEIHVIGEMKEQNQQLHMLPEIPEEIEDGRLQNAALSSFPYSLYFKTVRSVITEYGEELLYRSPNEGCAILRNSIASYLLRYRGLFAQPEQIIIGSGAEHLYGTVVRILGADKIYGIENPGYPKIAKIYDSMHVSYSAIDLDKHGVCIDSLENHQIDIMHLSPSHHFPTGIITPISRRYELLGWASKDENRYIIEDDYDSELRLGGKPIPTLQSIDISDKVIYMNTFTKTLSSTVRISYMVLPASLTELFYKKLSFYSCTVSNFEQYTLARFMESGSFEKHINRLRNYYQNKRDAILEIFKTAPLDQYITIKEEDSGVHFMMKLKTERTEMDMMSDSKSKGIKLAPLSKYFVGQTSTVNFQNVYVMNYSSIDLEQLPLIFDALCQVLIK